MFVIFENNAINVKSNSTIYIVKTLVIKDLALNIKKYYPSVCISEGK